jgi:predicted nucleic acid-binding protein
MMVVDTSGLFALLAGNDTNHRAALEALAGARPPLLVPAPVLGEAGYMIETRLGTQVLESFVEDLVEGTFSLDCGEDSLPRALQLVRRYASLPLGLTDAAVVASAERWSAPVLTFDRRDFAVVARDGTIRLAP